MPRRIRNRRSNHRPQFETLESRTLPSTSSVWTILGDQEAGSPDDTSVIQRSSRNANVLWAVVNGEVISTHRVDNLADLQIYAGAGDDTVAVNVGNQASSFVVQAFGGLGDDQITGT